MDPVTSSLTLAYGLDWAVGDPRWLPHPVRGLGWAIRRAEEWLRARVRNEGMAGGLLVAGIAAGTWALVRAAIGGAARVGPGWAMAAETAFLYACLSTRDLAVEAWPVYRRLKQGELPAARRHLSMIVGRDTDSLDEPEVARATLETIAESTMDGIVAPLFYAVIGGAPLACLYKAVNTLDSMVGYRSARYLRFGRVAAWVDRWMNRIPAWATAGFLSLAAGRRARRSWRAAWAARRRGENSFLPEAAMAGALGVRLGGTNRYRGVPVETPWMGEGRRPLSRDRIPEAIRLMKAASILAFSVGVGVRWLWWSFR